MSSQPARKNRYVFKLLLLCVSSVVALVLCELVLQIVLFRKIDKFYIWPPHVARTFDVHKDIMPGIFGKSEFNTNSIGIRGEELAPDNTYRILALGGSTTECLYLDQSETWTHLTEQILNDRGQGHNVWFGNGGISGRDTRHHHTALRHLPLGQWNVDAVVLLVGINDLSLRLSHDEDYDRGFLKQSKSAETLLAETFTGRRLHPHPDERFYKKTAVWRLMRVIRERWQRKNVQDEAGTIYSQWREHRKSAEEIRDKLPDLSSALKQYASNLNQIIDLAEQHSLRVIFMTQPAVWRSDLPEEMRALLWMGGVGRFQDTLGHPYYSVAVLERAMKTYNDVLQEVCQDRAVECVDLASVLEKNSSVFYDDVHFNENGARQVADALSDHLLQRAPFR